MRTSLLGLGIGSVMACGLLGACGGGSYGKVSSKSAASNSASSTSSSGAGVSALSAEARSLATGDIPDNQVFLTFRDQPASYSMVYPEGWARQGSAAEVTFREKSNVIHIAIVGGAPPTPASVTAELARERSKLPSLSYGSPSTISIQGVPAVKVSYSTLSPPNPVTGKRVRLLVDRYVLAHAGKVATLDLGTPAGVDNVDAYRRISHSFSWR